MIHSLVELGLLASGLASALALFLSAKREMHAQSREHRARMDQVLQQLRDAQQASPENGPLENAATASAHFALRSGMNLNRRVQAVRLLRRGEEVSHVAAVLGVPRREIELLIRVQKLSAQRAAGAGG
jgi:hypothetical protein